MAGNWYKTGTVKVTKGSAVVTGTGTAWADNKQGIGPGQMFLVPGSGTVLMFEILSVDSNTQLTLVSAFTGTTATAAAYAIPSFYVDSVPDFARRLAAQLSYYQSQMDGWQQIMTGTGTIAMTAPDGTAVNISSFAKLTSDINASFHEYGALSGTDLNTLGSVASSGVYYQTANASATAALNYPEQKAGTLIVSKSAYSGCQQLYIPFDTGQIYMRGLTTNWNGTDGPWAVWKLVGAAYRTASSIDLNTLTGSALLVGGSYTNGPATMGNSSCFVTSIARNDSNLTAQTLNYTSTNRVFTRTNVSGTWSAWAEIYTTLTKPSATDVGAVPLSGGTMSGQLLTDSKAGYKKKNTGWTSNTSDGYNYMIEANGPDTTTTLQHALYVSNGNYWASRFILTIGSTFKLWEMRSDGSFRSDGTVYASGTALTSDRRLKSNFEDVGYELDIIDKIVPQYYDKCTPDDDKNITRELGVVAQDLQKILPNLVSEYYWNEKYPDLLSINYSGLSSWLVGYVAKLKNTVKQQEEVINSMEVRLKKLESQMTELIGISASGDKIAPLPEESQS